ncbi:hypothetical protein Plhal304r1_c020g0071181 [Plasmopara halstedii]
MESLSYLNGMVVVVEIKSGQGNGLTNDMINHVFNSQTIALEYVRQQLGYRQTEKMEKLSQMPFLQDLLGFIESDLIVYPRLNSFTRDLDNMYKCMRIRGELNGMAIYLGCALDNGLSMHLNARGDAFFIGTTSTGKPVTSNVLWGAASFIYKAMDYYSDEDYAPEQREELFRKWGQQYRMGTWEPMAGSVGLNLYQTDPFKCQTHWTTLDHRTHS